MPIPEPGFVVPKAMYDSLKLNKMIIPITTDQILLRNNNIKNILNKIGAKDFKIFDVYGYFCSDYCKYSLKDGSPLYFDSHHLSLKGANLLKPLFRQILE